MEHDSSRSGYHEPEPGSAGLSATEEDWGDDYPKTFSVNLIWGEARDKEGRARCHRPQWRHALALCRGYEAFQGADRLPSGDYGS